MHEDDDEAMLASVRAPRRVISEVSYEALVLISGSLPTLAPDIEALGRRGRSRQATSAEIAMLRWWIGFDGGQVASLAATHDRFDWPTSADVREIVHIVGTKRGVTEMLRWHIALADADDRPLYGAFDAENRAAIRHAVKLGCVLEREVYAIGGETAWV